MSLNRKSIFIVEDNTANRVTYQYALSLQGAYVYFEASNADALRKLQLGRHYDLIILDLMLPHGKTTYPLFEEIRKLPQCSGVPIIAVSAAEPSEAMARCRELGFDGYIAKPINEQIFPSQLERVLAGEPVWSY